MISKEIDIKVNSIVGLVDYEKDVKEIFSSLVFNITDSRNCDYKWHGLIVSYYDTEDHTLYFKEILGVSCSEMPIEFHNIFSEAIKKYLGDFLFDAYIKWLDHRSIFIDKSIDRFGTIGQIFEVIGVKSYG